ncbi:MAG TPA: AtpZ/AtpI family protein [Pyrinomonadaceae bacterium]|jgi:F0F1-type ATP synthase assembly protein I
MPERDEEDVARRSGVAYAAAISLFFSVATLLGLGYLLDRWLRTEPWLMVAGIVVGSAVGLYEFVRITSKISED